MFEARQEIKFAIILGTCLLVILLLVVILAITLYRTRQAKYMEETENLRSRFQKEILQAQLEIREQTLKNISQEIHDNIGQTLSLAKLNLNTVDYERAAVVRDKVGQSRALVSKAIHDLRNLSRSLNMDSILSEGLIRAVETELEIIQNAGVYRTRLDLTGQPVRIDPKKELILFRIIQEAINNIIKHSGATAVTVATRFAPGDLVVEVTDNGTGFDDAATGHEGSGLRNMKSRAEVIGGHFALQTRPTGTTITITLPITPS